MAILQLYSTYFTFSVRYFTGEDTAEHAKAALTQEIEKMDETLHRSSTVESASPATSLASHGSNWSKHKQKQEQLDESV